MATLYPVARYGTYTVADDQRRQTQQWQSAPEDGANGTRKALQTEAELVDWLRTFHERIEAKAAAAQAVDQRRRDAAAREAERWIEVKKAAAAEEELARLANLRADEDARQAAESAAAGAKLRNEVDWICRDMTAEQRQAWERDQAELDALEGLIDHHESRLAKYAAFSNTEYQQYLDRVARENAAQAAIDLERQHLEKASAALLQFNLWQLETEALCVHASTEMEELTERFPLHYAFQAGASEARDAARQRCFRELSAADQDAIEKISDPAARSQILDDLVEMACLKAASKRAAKR